MRVLLACVLLACAVPALAADALVPKLAWLAGCWKRTTQRRVVEERWIVPKPGLMLGLGRTTNAAGDTLIEYEQTRIQQRGDTLVYTASPSGQRTDSFRSITLTDSMVVFENKAHDFPQRVGYALKADGSLAAWIEGMRNGQVKHVDFPYARVSCPGK
jgi:hypothetical protein